ncbi:MAG: pilus assembly protein CpaC, partial [Sphingomonadales bacterium]|nr:pilus assembly protein CpaC [Sphingomonadales bacterium]
MHKTSFLSRVSVGTASAALVAASLATAVPAPAFGASNPPAVRPANDVTLSVGTGRMVRLDAPMSDLFVANDGVADVQVRSANQVYIFGKAPGETTVFATDKAGHTIYSANVRVGTNIASVDEMLHLAMPEAQIRVTPMNGTVLLTGTVAAPDDVEEATRLVQNYVGQGTQVLSRLKSATPLQVMLQVKVAEVSRSLVRQIGVNL